MAYVATYPDVHRTFSHVFSRKQHNLQHPPQNPPVDLTPLNALVLLYPYMAPRSLLVSRGYPSAPTMRPFPVNFYPTGKPSLAPKHHTGLTLLPTYCLSKSKVGWPGLLFRNVPLSRPFLSCHHPDQKRPVLGTKTAKSGVHTHHILNRVACKLGKKCSQDGHIMSVRHFGPFGQKPLESFALKGPPEGTPIPETGQILSWL